MDIVIIGTGNTATVLGRKLKDAGHRIIQVFGRDAAAASELAYILDCDSTNYWSVVSREADLYLLAISDIAVDTVVSKLQLPDKTIVHTAAALPIDLLKSSSPHYGVFYPLQSLNKERPELPEIPIIIEASDESTLHQLERLGHTISDQVVEAGAEQRLKLHLAAVFCNNFTNHLYVLMENWCREQGLDFKLLLPLIRETSERLDTISPLQAQTGPAIRNDTATIKQHLELLADQPMLKEIYELMTRSIQTGIVNRQS